MVKWNGRAVQSHQRYTPVNRSSNTFYHLTKTFVDYKNTWKPILRRRTYIIATFQTVHNSFGSLISTSRVPCRFFYVFKASYFLSVKVKPLMIELELCSIDYTASVFA